jgi:hypothetical protein
MHVERGNVLRRAVLRLVPSTVSELMRGEERRIAASCFGCVSAWGRDAVPLEKFSDRLFRDLVTEVGQSTGKAKQKSPYWIPDYKPLSVESSGVVKGANYSAPTGASPAGRA